ncbi:MAG: hypothetical protein IJA20_01900 [Methanocorpusculum sp.]|nr:hypothetical protein [Methanocorpusculum sp.]
MGYRLIGADGAVGTEAGAGGFTGAKGLSDAGANSIRLGEGNAVGDAGTLCVAKALAKGLG